MQGLQAVYNIINENFVTNYTDKNVELLRLGFISQYQWSPTVLIVLLSRIHVHQRSRSTLSYLSSYLFLYQIKRPFLLRT